MRFTQHETSQLLRPSGVALSEAGVATLHQRAEGWAAGLRLAAISLASSPDPERFVAEFSGSSRTVAEYLLAEMLEGQPAEVQQLLLRTSLLDRVNGELADLLTDHPGAERILLDLEDANAFVVSLDPNRTWFRYHRLFADLLRLELRMRRRTFEELPMLHRLAATWFGDHGEIVDAISHTQAAGDWARSRAAADPAPIGMARDGQAQTIETLLRAFPPGEITDGPDLPLARATAYLARGRLDQAAGHLAVAETLIRSASSGRRHPHEVATAATHRETHVRLARQARPRSYPGVQRARAGHGCLSCASTRQTASPASPEDIALDSANLGARCLHPVLKGLELGARSKRGAWRTRTAGGTCRKVPIWPGRSDVLTSKWPALLSSPLRPVGVSLRGCHPRRRSGADATAGVRPGC